MRIYDPCSGSGGMLIHSKEYVDERRRNSRNLGLYGQESNGGVWAICKMNMLLHGIPDADIQNGDTLAEPLHTEGGELMRFDRVITNPPFTQNYSTSGMLVQRALPVRLLPGERQEGRPDVRPAHGRGAPARRHGGNGHAPRRAVPRRRREDRSGAASSTTTSSRR